MRKMLLLLVFTQMSCAVVEVKSRNGVIMISHEVTDFKRINARAARKSDATADSFCRNGADFLSENTYTKVVREELTWIPGLYFDFDVPHIMRYYMCHRE